MKSNSVLAKVKSILFLLIISSPGMTQAPTSALLWRISGNGLQKPSYLFGTIHLTDKRVFNFGDSLYDALEFSSGYAMEVHPDSALMYYFTKLKDKKPSPLLKDVVSQKKFSAAKKKLETTFKKSADKITVGDLRTYYSEWFFLSNDTGRMQTVMDTYLYNVVRKQGKWVGGIEDPQDQIDLLEDMEDDYSGVDFYLADFMNDSKQNKRSLEEMILRYTSSDLEAIQEISDRGKYDKEAFITHRNVKMARRIDSLAKIRNTFFAIGSAHLPGDSGVINLLRARGYVVTPVISSHNIPVEKYAFKELKLPWVKVTSASGLYSAEMPGAPQNDLPGAEDVDMKMYADIGTNLYYFTMGTIGKQTMSLDSAVKKVVKNMTKRADVVGLRNIQQGEFKGIECYAIAPNLVYKIHMFSKGAAVYLAMVGTVGTDTTFPAEANRFFDSFVMNPPPAVVPTGSTMLVKPNLGFSIHFPLKPSMQKKTDDDTNWKVTNYTAIDIDGDIYYQCIIKDVAKGYYQDGEVSALENYRKNVEEKYKLVSFRDTVFQGYKGVVTEFTDISEGTPYYDKLLNVYRGNRMYVLIVTTSKKKENQVQIDSFFNSFMFTPLQEPVCGYQQSSQVGVKTWGGSAIEPFRTDSDLKSPPAYWTIQDSLAPVSYFIRKDGFSKYYWAKDDTSLLRSASTNALGATDSILSYNVVTNGRYRAVDASATLHNTQNIRRVRIVLAGDTLYSFFAVGPKEVFDRADNQRMFQEFTVLNDTATSHLFDKKVGSLLNALQSSDSATFADARQVLEQVMFTSDDLPQLHQALLKEYRDSTEYRNASESLFEAVASMKNPSTVEFVRNEYPRLQPKQEGLKYSMLYLLAHQKNDTAYSLLNQLLLKKWPESANAYTLFNALEDSLPMAARFYPMVFSHLNDSNAVSSILSLTTSLLDSGVIDKKMLVDNKQRLFACASSLLKRVNQGEGSSAWYETNLLSEVLQKMKTPEANEWLRKMMNQKDKEVKYYGAMALLKNQQQVPPSILLQFAADKDKRLELYSKLKDLKKLSLFPKQYYDQRHFAESEMYSVNEEDDNISSIKLLGERIVTFMGEKKRFFIYKVNIQEDDNVTSYLGVVGAYKLNPAELTTEPYASGMYMDEKFSTDKISEQFKKFLKREEEYTRTLPVVK